jgi:hypothetical protein
MLVEADETNKGPPLKPQTAKFDTDSFDIGIDNRCTKSISHKIKDFDGPLMDTNRKIWGFAGTSNANVKIRTIKWTILDNVGKPHTIILPGSLYIPEGGVRLLSPQH